MATYTKYKMLELPIEDEKYNIRVANKNNDIIDSEFHKLDLKNESQDSLLATKDALNSEISRATNKENEISTDLDDEISRATVAENELSNLISSLTTRLNTLADSDDTTLDQLSEIVAYIKNNKSLIDGITTSKINVSDIIDNLTSTATNKPLSAKQGKALKDLITDLTTLVGDKVDKVSGKGLSTNDFTTTDKDKLDGIASGAEINVQSDWNISDTASDAYIKNKPTSLPASDVPAWAKATSKPSYTKDEVGLGNVENKSSATIRGELTKENVVNALGYTPPTSNSQAVTGVKGNAESSYRTGNVNLTPENIGLGTLPCYRGSNNSGTISGDLNKYNVSSDMTLEQLYTALPNQSFWEIYFNSQNNTLNYNMPVTSGGILTVYKNDGNRGLIFFFDYRTGKLYMTPKVENIEIKWRLTENIIYSNSEPTILYTDMTWIGT